jgi:phosphinothricin acetyltransferase
VEATIRGGREDDLEAIQAVYEPYVRETAITFDLVPYSTEQRRAWLAGFAAGGRHQLFVAERSGRVVGYACSRRFREKAAYDPTVETSVYLAPECCRHGLGARLYTRLFDALEGEDVHLAIAGITLPNDASVKLHERFGFETVGVMREVGRKLGRFWDVLWMQRRLSGR